MGYTAGRERRRARRAAGWPGAGWRADPLEPRRLMASIAGSVFVDYNNDGQLDNGEGSPGNNTQLVFLDANANGVRDGSEPGTSVDAFGDYSFNGLSAGTYRVTLIQDQGYVRSSPSADFRSVTVSASSAVTGQNFGLTQVTQVYGTVGNDANGNGKVDAPEPGLPNATAYVDVNGNGSRDSATQSATNASSVPVAAGATGGSTISVGASTGLVLNAVVTVNLSTADDKSTRLTLVDPQGVRVLLLAAGDTSGGSGGNLANTTFDDSPADAAKTLNSATPPFTGTFRTSGGTDLGFGLTNLDALSPAGTWRLVVAAGSHPVTLSNWTLKLTVGDPAATTQSSGAYALPIYPGTWTVRAADSAFATTAPSGGKYTTTLGYSDQREDDFELHQTTGTSQTVLFGPAADPNKGSSDSPFDVVTADVNGDGKVDLIALNNGSNDVAVYTGKGNGTFNNPVFYAVGAAPRGLAVGDFNKDGHPDLVATNHDDSNVSVLINAGNGTFKPQATYAAVNGAWSVATGDFNGDGKADLVVGGNGTGQVRVLLGKGDGTFTQGALLATASDVYGVAVGDLNKDGHADVFAANAMNDSVSVLLGNGNDTFKAAVAYPAGASPDGLAVADVNGDGVPDVAVTDYDAGTVDVLLGKSGGTLGAAVAYAAGDTPAAATFADVNLDGHLDLIVTDRSDGGTPISGDVKVYPGVGNGTFGPAFTFTAHTSPTGVATGDFNGDGSPDLAAANFNSDDVSVLLNLLKPTTSTPTPTPTPTGTKLAGTAIGTAGSYNNGGNTIAKALDGSLSTYFDGPTANGDTVGLDLGAAATITAVAYASRSGWAGRMNGGYFQASNSPTFASGNVTLYTIAANANPSSTALTTQAVSVGGTYRYVRYVAPNGSYGDVAEVQFFGTAGSTTPTATRLTGTTFGTAGSYNNGGNTVAKATDGDPNTFFDGPAANGNVVGIDLGSAKAVTQIRFAPRGGFASRMVGGTFQAADDANFTSGVTTAYTVTAAPAVGSLTTVAVSGTHRYWRYVAPNGSYGDIAEFELFG